MENESISAYVSYDVQKLYCEKPDGPITCPVCGGGFKESIVEPSKAMSEYIAGPDYCDDGSSLLFVCNTCRWWCVREHYEFVDVSCAHRYGCDYLIFSAAKGGKSEDMSAEYIQPWLKALDDLTVYDKVQNFPEKIAVFFRGGMTWKEYGEKRKRAKRR